LSSYKKLSIFDEITLVQDDYESLEVLVVLSSTNDYYWIMDSSYLFHMTPNHLWF